MGFRAEKSKKIVSGELAKQSLKIRQARTHPPHLILYSYNKTKPEFAKPDIDHYSNKPI